MGLTCDRQVKPTRRGLTTFLAAVGQRGLLFMVEISLLVVVQPAGQRDVMVDATLLDACGDVVAPCITAHRMVPGCRQACCEHILADTDLTRAMTSIYVLAMAHFDLVPVVGRGAQRLLP